MGGRGGQGRKKKKEKLNQIPRRAELKSDNRSYSLKSQLTPVLATPVPQPELSCSHMAFNGSVQVRTLCWEAIDGI